MEAIITYLRKSRPMKSVENLSKLEFLDQKSKKIAIRPKLFRPKMLRAHPRLLPLPVAAHSDPADSLPEGPSWPTCPRHLPGPTWRPAWSCTWPTSSPGPAVVGHLWGANHGEEHVRVPGRAGPLCAHHVPGPEMRKSVCFKSFRIFELYSPKV